MVVPSLWTNGFDSNPKNPNRSSPIGFFNKKINDSDENENKFSGMSRFIPMYIYSLGLVEIVAATLSVIMKKKMTISLLTITYQQIKLRTLSVLPKAESIVIMTISIMKIILAGLLVKPLNMLVDRCNRRYLWNHRQTMTYGGLVSITTLLVSVFLRNIF